MNKRRLLCILLILAMVAFLFAGCGKDKSPGTDPDILEGTWRGTELIDSWVDTENGKPEQKHYKEECPYTEDLTEALSVSIEYYLQVKNNTLKMFDKYIFDGEFPSDYADDNLPKEFLLLETQGSYSISGNKMIVTFFDEEGEEEKSTELTYTISGNSLILIDEYEYIYYNEDGTEDYRIEGTQTEKYIKVPDSKVANPIDIEDYPRLEVFLDEWVR